MALVTKRWSGRGLTKSGGGWSHPIVYDVTDVTTEDDAIQAVEDAYPETAHNHESPYDDNMYCESRRGESTGFNFWTVTVTYTSTPAGRHFDHGSPLNEPTVWRVVPAVEQGTSSVDALGKEVLNTSGQAFSSDPPAFNTFVTLIGQRIEPYFDLQKALQYTNAINDTPLTFDNNWTLEKGQMCCRFINLVSTVTGHEKYVVVEYIVELREGFTLDSDGYRDGFKIRILNEGTQGFYPDGEDRPAGPLCHLRVDPQTKQNVPEKVSYPVLLDQQGRPVSEGIYVMCPKEVDERGYTDPVGNNDIYAGVIEATDYAYYIKIFPSGYKFKNLADLGL
jgi:hypothetical protein